ncbi:MAG: sce7726 family protein, partial [Microbacterium sp.]|nr:sce7726 family protein [Microbacterium sp.]
MAPVTELEIRSAVHEAVVRGGDGDGLVIDEFVVGERGRIDIAVIGDHLVGYELKSDLDTLSRLPRQMDVFGDVFHYCTLVVTPRHLAKARQILRRGWGLAVVDRTTDDTLAYRQLRQPREIMTVRKLALVELLWRDETLRALDTLGLADGYRTKAKHILWERLATAVELDQLRKIVTAALMTRQGWRDVRAPHGRDARSQPAG